MKKDNDNRELKSKKLDGSGPGHQELHLGFGHRMREIRKMKSLSQEDFAQRIGLSKGTVQNIERGSLPKGDNILAICTEFNVSADWLLFGISVNCKHSSDNEVYGPSVSELTNSFQEGDSVIPKSLLGFPEAEDLNEARAYDYTLIPLSEAYLTAGCFSFVPSNKRSKLMAFSREWLCSYSTGVKNVVLMYVRGNSMSPTIEDGDLVMLDAGRSVVHDGGIYAIGINNSIAVKRLRLQVGGDTIQVLNDNRKEYPPAEVSSKDLNIIGQIIWYARELIK